MIGLLFDTSFWYDVITLIFIVALIYIFCKYKQSRIYVYWIFFVLVVALTGCCVVQLIGYYTTSGNQYGNIDNDKPNEIEQVSEFSFNLKNIVLTQESGDKYSANMTANVSLDLTPNSDYGLYVNDITCNDIVYSVDYITGKYTYNFYDNANKLLKSDTLTLSLAFNKTYMSLTLSTSGGAEAVRYWNNYFNKNNFVVEIKEQEELNSDTIYGEGDISNFRTAKFYVNEQLYRTYVYELGDKIVDPQYIDPTYHLDYWTCNGERVDFTNFICNDNYVFEAVLITNERHTVDIYLSTDGTADGIIDAGNFYVTDTMYIDTKGNGTNHLTIEGQSDKEVIVDFKVASAFENFDWQVQVETLSDGNIQVNKRSTYSTDLMSTGFAYGGDIVIEGLTADANIYVTVKPVEYKLEIYYSFQSTFLVDDFTFTYGSTFNLKEHLTAEQLALLTGIEGLYTMQTHSGTKYFDSNLEMLTNWTSLPLKWIGSSYVYVDNFNKATNTFTLYAFYG